MFLLRQTSRFTDKYTGATELSQRQKSTIEQRYYLIRSVKWSIWMAGVVGARGWFIGRCQGPNTL